LVGRGIERTLYFQAGFGRRRSNQLNYGHAIDEWSPAPILRDVAEQTVKSHPSATPFSRPRTTP
jgi:hypothetical protein